ncbi:hypothetical protein GCM10027047_36340 [Rhodococcus aerolatus]
MKVLVVALAVAGVVLAGCSSEPTQLTTAECAAVLQQRSAAPPPEGSAQADLAALGCADLPVTTAPPTTTTTTTTAPTTTVTSAAEVPVVEAEPEPAQPTAMTDAECDAYAASSPLPNAELFPEMRAIGCGDRLDELEAAATASAEAEAQTYQPPTSTYEIPSCPAGQVFSGLGGGCMSPEESATISYNEGLCGGGYGPVEICGPGRQGG